MPDHNSLLRNAILAAISAGKEIMSVYKEDFEITLKDDQSPLTNADRKAHKQIIAQLHDTALPVLSEEGRSVPFEERKTWKLFWLVDPLDGTKEFIRKNGEFTVNIALIENNLAVLGVIYVPVSDILFIGAKWLPGKMIQNVSQFIEPGQHSVSAIDRMLAAAISIPITKKERPYTVVASRSHLSPETSSFISSLKKKYGDLAFISKGSSLKICLVAEGIADIYPRLAPTMEWDTAAGQAIAESAGCTVTDYHTGSQVMYNKENLLNPHFVVMRP